MRFKVVTAKGYPGSGHDMVAMFNCLHDMGDATGVSAHVKSSLKPDSAWMIVESFGNDHLEDNLNTVGRVFYPASTLICTPASGAPCRLARAAPATGIHVQAGHAAVATAVCGSQLVNLYK